MSFYKLSYGFSHLTSICISLGAFRSIDCIITEPMFSTFPFRSFALCLAKWSLFSPLVVASSVACFAFRIRLDWIGSDSFVCLFGFARLLVLSCNSVRAGLVCFASLHLALLCFALLFNNIDNSNNNNNKIRAYCTRGAGELSTRLVA